MRPIQSLLTSVILSVHAVVFCFFLTYQIAPYRGLKRLTVKERTLAARPKTKPKKAPPRIKKARATPKKKSVKKTKPKPKEPSIPAHLLDQIEESIAKIEKKPHKRPHKTQLEVPVLEVSKESATSYQDKVIAILHRSLSLPEHGEVDVQLTLLKDGRVQSVEIKQAASTKNKEYLKQNLPQVIFPPFAGSLRNKEKQTFAFTFCNEI